MASAAQLQKIWEFSDPPKLLFDGNLRYKQNAVLGPDCLSVLQFATPEDQLVIDSVNLEPHRFSEQSPVLGVLPGPHRNEYITITADGVTVVQARPMTVKMAAVGGAAPRAVLSSDGKLLAVSAALSQQAQVFDLSQGALSPLFDVISPNPIDSIDVDSTSEPTLLMLAGGKVTLATASNRIEVGEAQSAVFSNGSVVMGNQFGLSRYRLGDACPNVAAGSPSCGERSQLLRCSRTGQLALVSDTSIQLLADDLCVEVELQVNLIRVLGELTTIQLSAHRDVILLSMASGKAVLYSLPARSAHVLPVHTVQPPFTVVVSNGRVSLVSLSGSMEVETLPDIHYRGAALYGAPLLLDTAPVSVAVPAIDADCVPTTLIVRFNPDGPAAILIPASRVACVGGRALVYAPHPAVLPLASLATGDLSLAIAAQFPVPDTWVPVGTMAGPLFTNPQRTKLRCSLGELSLPSPLLHVYSTKESDDVLVSNDDELTICLMDGSLLTISYDTEADCFHNEQIGRLIPAPNALTKYPASQLSVVEVTPVEYVRQVPRRPVPALLISAPDGVTVLADHLACMCAATVPRLPSGVLPIAVRTQPPPTTAGSTATRPVIRVIWIRDLETGFFETVPPLENRVKDVFSRSASQALEADCALAWVPLFGDVPQENFVNPMVYPIGAEKPTLAALLTMCLEPPPVPEEESDYETMSQERLIYEGCQQRLALARKAFRELARLIIESASRAPLQLAEMCALLEMRLEDICWHQHNWLRLMFDAILPTLQNFAPGNTRQIFKKIDDAQYDLDMVRAFAFKPPEPIALLISIFAPELAHDLFNRVNYPLPPPEIVPGSDSKFKRRRRQTEARPSPAGSHPPAGVPPRPTEQAVVTPQVTAQAQAVPPPPPPPPTKQELDLDALLGPATQQKQGPPPPPAPLPQQPKLDLLGVAAPAPAPAPAAPAGQVNLYDILSASPRSAPAQKPAVPPPTATQPSPMPLLPSTQQTTNTGSDFFADVFAQAPTATPAAAPEPQRKMTSQDALKDLFAQ